MFTTRKYVSGVVAAIAFGAIGAGCESAGLDNLPNVGLTDTFVGKPAPEPDLKQNAPLVMPPKNAPLPVPGQQGSAQWPVNTDQAKTQQAANQSDPCQNGSASSDKCNPSWIDRVLHPGG